MRYGIAKKIGYYSECMSLLYRLLAIVEQKGNADSYKDAVLQPALNYMDAHFTEHDFSCALLSELCAISYSYFKRLFLRKFNMPPIKYVNEKRIRLACDLIRSRHYTQTEIARMTGFETVYYFSRVFKSVMGMPPSAYLGNRIDLPNDF